MSDFDYDFMSDDNADDDTIEELKKTNKSKKSFSEVINKKKLSKYDLDEVML